MMLRHVLVLALAFLVGDSRAAALEPGTLGPMECAPARGLIEAIETGWKERLVGSGIAQGNHARIAVYATPDGATWTILVLGADGIACLTASGTDWRIEADGDPI